MRGNEPGPAGPRSTALSYAVPIQRVPVELVFEDASPRRGELFVGEPDRGGQALLRLLEGQQRFLPFLDIGHRVACLINRDALVVVILLATPIGGQPPLPPERRQRVSVELRPGIVLEGEVLFSAPPSRSRLSDHLNEPSRFLVLARGGETHFIHKQQVVRVAESVAAASFAEVA